MKHRSKKKGHHHHHHGKHKHTDADGSSLEANGGGHGDNAEASAVGSPRVALRIGRPAAPSTASHRLSMCEYCGAGSVPSASATDASAPISPTEDVDGFGCPNSDCERYVPVDIDCVISSAAFQLRAPALTAFYCQCGVLLSEIHALIRTAGQEGLHSAFTEETVQILRPKLLALFTDLVHYSISPGSYACSLCIDHDGAGSHGTEHDRANGGGEGGGGGGGKEHDEREPAAGEGPTCPFVPLLSTMLPSLHKFLVWVQLTKPLWWLATGSPSSSPTASPLSVLAAQLQLHDLLTLMTTESSRLSMLMEENHERDHDLSQLKPATPHTPRRSHANHSCNRSGNCSSSSSSSSSSSLLSPRFRPGSASAHDLRLPQVQKISFEFDEVLAEFKFELAELTEALLDSTEFVAVRLSRLPPPPPPSPAAAEVAAAPPRAKSTANEFVELLLLHVLSPLSERVVSSPSHSRSYIFPRLLERCISITIDEYVLETRKRNEAFAAQFDKAIDLLRCWSTDVDAAYDKQLISAPRDVARLSLVSLDAFKRLELLQLTWLRQGKDGDRYAPRLTFRTNLETLRSTLKRTMTARNTDGGGGGGGGTSSGIATPTTS